MKIYLMTALLALVMPAQLLANTQQQADTTIKYHTNVVFQPNDSRFTADTTLTIPAEKLTHQAIALLLSKQQSVTEISGAQLASSNIESSPRVPPWNRITLNFKNTDQSNYKVRLKYSGAIDEEAGHGNYINAQGAHLSLDSAWHPFIADFATKMTGALALTVPSNWRVYSPGQQERPTQNTVMVRNQMPAIDVVLFAQQSPQVITTEHVEVIYQGIDAKQAQHLADDATQCLTSLNATMRAENTLDHADLIILDRSGPSFARGPYISMSKSSLSSREADYQYICHELAHNWTPFADAMSHDYWMMESFAEYISAQQLKQRFGKEAYADAVKRWHNLAKGVEFVWRSDDPKRASHRVNYGLGPLLLKRLADRMGADNFEQLLAWYTAHEVTQTEQLLNKIGAVTSKETQIWFTQQLAQKKP